MPQEDGTSPSTLVTFKDDIVGTTDEGTESFTDIDLVPILVEPL